LALTEKKDARGKWGRETCGKSTGRNLGVGGDRSWGNVRDCFFGWRDGAAGKMKVVGQGTVFCEEQDHKRCLFSGVGGKKKMPTNKGEEKKVGNRKVGVDLHGVNLHKRGTKGDVGGWQERF